MIKAYDTILETEINAKDVDNNDDDRYRFECSCCGEQVILAAKESFKVIPHFRHLKNNNDTDCELYISQNQSLSNGNRSRKSRREIFEIFYDSYNSLFKIGIKFDEISLQWSEEKKVLINLKDDSKNILNEIKVNRTNFFPDDFSYYSIPEVCGKIYISNTEYGEREIEFLNVNKPSFFKIINKNSNNSFMAKKIRKSELYENVEYFLVAYKGLMFADQLKDCKLCNIEKICEIKNKYGYSCYIGYKVVINGQDSDIRAILNNWGFTLSKGESFVFLWPPISRKGDYFITKNESLIVYSTFLLKSHSNISLDDNKIHKIDDDIYVLNLDLKTKIFNKNTDIIVKKEDIDFKETEIQEEHVSCKNYKHNNGEFKSILIDRSGTRVLQDGEELFLTKEMSVFETKNSYIYKTFEYNKKKEMNKEEKLIDIISHYKREIAFIEKGLKSECQAIQEYIDQSEKKELINPIVLEMIKRGDL